MDKFYTVLVFFKNNNAILKESASLRPHEIPFYLDNEIDLSRHNFKVIEEKTGEYIHDGKGWKYSPVVQDD